jgi:hypothetical protein
MLENIHRNPSAQTSLLWPWQESDSCNNKAYFNPYRSAQILTPLENLENGFSATESRSPEVHSIEILVTTFCSQRGRMETTTLGVLL